MATMEGWLNKKPMKSLRVWKKRYFVFKDGVLSYFKKPGADSRGELELTADTTVTLSESKTNCFELVSGRAGLYAHAETDADCKAWVAALKAHVDSLQAGGGKGGGGGGGAGGGSSGVKMHSFAVSGTRFHIPEQYELIKPIGQGAYGVVISANDTESGEKIAIKKITRAFEDLIDAKRILREIRLLKHFDHENIISIVSLIRPPSVRFEDIYIVSELMDTDLHRVIYSRQKLSDDHIQYFLYQLLRAMKYLHSANVLHRDLKPSNLLVNSNCDLKVCDFGLARGIISQDEGNAELTEYVVTRWYRAPEIMLACREYTRAVDVWSVGCILGELLGRKPLFPGNDYIHQLQIIADTVGSPPTEELHFITSEKAMRFMKSQPRKKKVPFSTIYPNSNPQALDMLDKMLVFDPDKRMTIEEALDHPYLEQLHHVDDEPVCPEPFDFSFEDEELDKPLLQKMIFEDSLDFWPDVGGAAGGGAKDEKK